MRAEEWLSGLTDPELPEPANEFSDSRSRLSDSPSSPAALPEPATAPDPQQRANRRHITGSNARRRTA